MELPLSTPLASRLLWMPEVGSTNTELVQHLSGSQSHTWPHLSVIASDNQTRGKGRLGRDWSAPAGASLAISVAIRPVTPSGRPLKPESLGWLGLLAGLAMARVCTAALPAGVVATVKWPNDVLINQRKVCGVLSELVMTPEGAAVVVGAGVNLSLTETQLPVPTATSLALEGADDHSADAILAGYLTEFSRIVGVFLAAEGDVVGSGLREAVQEMCDTVGRSVRVEMPSGEHLVGTAERISDSGAIVVNLANGLGALEVAAGDVTHLRVIMDGA
jgi:BirA family biotin operon repressor/biotin-[acetyl-CoA-carboxylase] ligase